MRLTTTVVSFIVLGYVGATLIATVLAYQIGVKKATRSCHSAFYAEKFTDDDNEEEEEDQTPCFQKNLTPIRDEYWHVRDLEVRRN